MPDGTGVHAVREGESVLAEVWQLGGRRHTTRRMSSGEGLKPHVPKITSFSTGPLSVPTHWKQTLFLLRDPIIAEEGERIVVRVFEMGIYGVWQGRSSRVCSSAARARTTRVSSMSRYTIGFVSPRTARRSCRAMLSSRLSRFDRPPLHRYEENISVMLPLPPSNADGFHSFMSWADQSGSPPSGVSPFRSTGQSSISLSKTPPVHAAMIPA